MKLPGVHTSLDIARYGVWVVRHSGMLQWCSLSSNLMVDGERGWQWSVCERKFSRWRHKRRRRAGFKVNNGRGESGDEVYKAPHRTLLPVMWIVHSISSMRNYVIVAHCAARLANHAGTGCRPALAKWRGFQSWRDDGGQHTLRSFWRIHSIR